MPNDVSNVGPVVGLEADHAGDQVFELSRVLSLLLVNPPKFFTPVVRYKLVSLILL